MHKFNLIADGDSIDFDFFEGEGNRFQTYEDGKKDSSKIITKAVIETKPKEKFKTNKTDFTLKTLKLNQENTVQTVINDCLFSPTSSEENRVLSNSVEGLTLFNCLAFNNDGKERQTFNMDDKYSSSDNSLSDSTITTVTSDFTTVSRLSSMSDSSCGSDLSTDSSTPQNCESPASRPNDDVENSSENIEDLDTEINKRSTTMRDLGDLPENLIHESDHSINSESINSDDEHHGDDNDYEDQENDSNRDRDSDIKSLNTGSRKTSIDIQSSNIGLYEIGNSNENQECSQNSQCSSLSRKGSVSTIGERLGDISLASQSSSSSNIARPHYCRGQNKFRSKKKELNLTFSREELIKIERDNTILLKKIMSYSKPRSVSLNHTFSHKKTSAAINRARQQKKIEQDNYILYNKINAMSRMKKVF